MGGGTDGGSINSVFITTIVDDRVGNRRKNHSYHIITYIVMGFVVLFVVLNNITIMYMGLTYSTQSFHETGDEPTRHKRYINIMCVLCGIRQPEMMAEHPVINKEMVRRIKNTPDDIIDHVRWMSRLLSNGCKLYGGHHIDADKYGRVSVKPNAINPDEVSDEQKAAWYIDS